MYLNASNSTGHQDVLLGVAVSNFNNDIEVQAQNAESLLGDTPNFIQFYHKFPPLDEIGSLNFREREYEMVKTHNAIPVVTWEPFHSSPQEHVTLEQLKSGLYDRYIREYASGLKAWKERQKYKIIVRLMHEHNLPGAYWWTHANAADMGVGSAARYIEMYNYIVDLVKDEGVDNALWAWCPNNDNFRSAGSASWNTIKGSFPGSKNIDILGLDGYSGDSYGADRTIEQILNFNNSAEGEGAAITEIKTVMNEAVSEQTTARVLENVPFWIFETNWRNYTTPPTAQQKRDWWIEGINYCRNNEVQAVCQFYVPNKDHLILTDYYTEPRVGKIANDHIEDYFPEYIH